MGNGDEPMPKPTQQRDQFLDAIADTISEFAKCLIVFFVLPPVMTLAVLSLMAWVR